ncbi:Ig-like domain-containing alpha-2-macroglobulin family protein [Vallitalea sp.]|jgi:hypothetical protein|uniref:Ig-like domain-containing alpha-2-macroglobulin family protein n=1 Tax=Vallitalea sp. TaxID=1882829 RepID=UPI0025E5DE2A|nr:Ig-like domain-containing alpha-2-macroglobulin family protein [Vallitalea sp.]MCT4686029.1 Ig-like domain-containing protein [Vallitalea sp.]
MKKKVVSLVLMAVLFITLFNGSSIYKGMDVNAEEFRNGYALIPQKFDSTGINTKTTFLLKADDDKSLALNEIKEGLKIEGDIEYSAKKTEEGFIITLAKELEKNSLYTFSFKDITWTFQTMSDFSLLGVLPRNESVNVPTNTGIEFYFSHENADVKDFFEISPKVNGKFETHGNVVVFAPKGGLEPKTLYTVTLKKGLKLNESEQVLKEDYVFGFETAPKKNNEYKEPDGYFNFKNIINEFSTSEKPIIPMDYYIYNEKLAKTPISVNVYSYKSMDDFAEAISKYNKIPRWSYFGHEDEKIETKGLSKVMDYKQPIDIEDYNQKFINLPDKLPNGYYIIDCSWEDITFQTFVQVTDLSFYYMSSGERDMILYRDANTTGNSNNPSIDSRNILWLNDLKTGKPVNNGVVTLYEGKETYKSNEKGIVEINRKNNDKTENTIYKIEAGNKSAVLVDFAMYGRDSASKYYWKYFQTDRGMYKPDDTVEFWGFLQNRYEDEKIKDITVEISQGGWFYWDYLPFSDEMPYEKTTIETDNGFYNGKIKLPNLEEGSYQISVKQKDQVISTSYIDVKNYVKPAYKIELSKDKEAIFLNEVVNFDINTLFFEGTPVSNLDVNYNINGFEHKNGTMTSDKKGNVSVSYTPKYVDGTQGIKRIRINAYAQLPESGEIYGSEDVRVFINDINVDIDSHIEGKKGTLAVQVNKYDLTRLNNDTAKDYNDYLGEAKEGQKITGTVYKNEWKRKEIGEYYDFINKVVRKQYEYYKETTKVKDVVLVTDKDGKAEIKVVLPDVRDCYYTAELNTVDSHGRKMKFSQYFGNYRMPNPPNSSENMEDRYMLKTDKDSYYVEEEMNIKFVNKDKILEKGSFLYVTAQNGIKDYEVNNSPEYKKIFDESSIPNVEIRGIYFNGKTYVEAESFSPRLDFEKNRIIFTAKTDKDNYKPGDLCKVSLKAMIYSKEENKNIPAKDVYVNASLVDEALLKLNDNEIDTLEELYQWVHGGIGSTYSSHNNMSNNMNHFGLRFGMDTEKSCDEAVSESPMMMNTKSDSADVYVRSVFKDTALFRTIKLDENGEGTFTFRLPDNVTSWRMTFAGISKTLKAGSNKEELIVSLPYFINTSLNKTYLVGDKPYIGVSVYGKELKEGENVKYQVTAEGTDYEVTATGKTFERVNIPLWEMKEEGTYDIVVKAISESGNTDGIKQTINVVKTYHEMKVADYYDLVKGMKIKTNDRGITNLTMVDKGRGKFVPELYSLMYNGGKRIDQKYLSYMASKMITDTFDMKDILKDEVKISDYQVSDGGFAILPYAESDIETTVKLLPIIKDDINTEKVKKYLYNELGNDKSRNKAVALYGLAILGDPVLLDIQKIEKISNLNLKDYLYLSLAYSELGDSYKATNIYDNKIAEYEEEYKTVKRINYGKSEDKYLEYTALMMMLASKLDMDDKDLYYEYVTTTYSKEILVNSEKLTYIIGEIDKVSTKKPKITYTYQGIAYEKVIKDGWPITIDIPSANLNQFKVNSVEGDVALIAVYNKALINNSKQDDNLTVKREYYNYATGKKTNTFNQSDIVKVVIDVDIDKNAIDKYYTVTDYAPSGLVPIEYSGNFGLRHDGWYYYKDVEGQKVTMHISKNYEYDEELYYYARVVTPGTYKADGTIVSGNKVKESIKISDTNEIAITK